ncbi:MAG: hypothetical protein HUJ98_04515 [Bacteroidaceae bacterium]|nr:hypothetical protein [Bacteroidaceae bacterium]
MEWYEIKALMKYDYYSYKDSWEQARLIAYLIAQTNSTKKLRLLDIIRFHWDTDEATPDTSIS